jgi:hypothetical protein
MTPVYDLNKVGDIQLSDIYKMNTDENKKTNQSILKDGNIMFRTCSTDAGKYRIMKYDKKFITPDSVTKAGLFRSVVIRDDNILSFSPPKSMDSADFIKQNPSPNKNHKKIVAEEFIEGTMINVFFDKSIGDDGDWEVSTRSNIGARTTFYRNGVINHEQTFRYMFLEAANNAELCFDNLSKEYCYSFVLQHPKNRIVVPVKEPLIYLVACYKIDNECKTVTEISREDQINIMEKTMVCFAARFLFKSYDELRKTRASDHTDYKIMGVVLKNIETGDRSKLRNPTYECVRKLRGNQPKLQYQYLLLRKDGNVSKYLNYFSEDTEAFTLFREQIHAFTNQLHTNYIMCYVKKTKPLIQYPSHFRTHMFNLHKLYLDHLREMKDKVTKSRVIEYINDLHPSKLMFSLNYPMRKQEVDSIVAAETQ